MALLRTVAASYWTALALGVLAIFLHVRWYTVDNAPGGEVVSGFGAALVTIGIVLGVASLLRDGLQSTARRIAHGPDQGVFAEAYAEARANNEATVPGIVRDLALERIGAAGAAILGTLLNGYGPLVARLLGLR